ncbi:4-hydroxy-tetrahydrodipicolinate synthase [Striga asiatica]|uniref:4-hydroxy-tetrahydrodipicolinate synthase n=1 Tax=Striga asiatica TaxID=4170 RepID=A0A5A7QV69_STRAF|nr:4-hydroxy-tetrahydrodipicolinate synthase [Striga asiatica]
MDEYCESYDMLDDVKRSKLWAQTARIMEEKGKDPDYEHMLRYILGRAESHNTNTVPLRIKCESASGSKSKPDKIRMKTKTRVEKTEIDRVRKNRHFIGNEADNSVSLYQEPNRTSGGLGAQRVMKSLKGKNVVREDTEDKKELIQVKSEDLDQERARGVKMGRKDKEGRVGKLGQGDCGLFLCPKIEDDNVKARSSRKQMYANITKTNCDGSHFEDDESETNTDLEVLDDAWVRKNLSSFEPSMRFHKSMEEDTSFGHTTGFRKKVVDALRKPFDKEELKMLRKAVIDGSYYFYYPDLERKVKRSRYKRGKCLNILRGFFFWIQNVSQAGSFKPWKDGQCLAVEPGSTEKYQPHTAAASRAHTICTPLFARRQRLATERCLLLSIFTIMARHFENLDMLNDVKKLKAKSKHSADNNGLAELKRITEKKNTDPNYKQMLRLIMSRAESHEQPNTRNKFIDYEKNKSDPAWPNGSRNRLLWVPHGKHDSGRRKHRTKTKKLVEIDRAKENVNLVGYYLDSVPFYQEPDRKSSQRTKMKNTRQVISKSRKGKNVVGEDSEETKPLVRVKREKLDCKCAHTVKPGKKDKAGRAGKLKQGQNGHFSSLKAEECNVKARSSWKRKTGLEILDYTVPSKRFRKSIEENTNFGHIGGSTSASDEFREQVIGVLGKTFDNKELKRLREAFEDGSQHKRRKSLNILRGFFFWLQHLTREGAFEPWKDSECLTVKPATPEKSPPSKRAKQTKHKRK